MVTLPFFIDVGWMHATPWVAVMNRQSFFLHLLCAGTAVVLGDVNMGPWYVNSRGVTFPDNNAKWIWYAGGAEVDAPARQIYWFNSTFSTARNVSANLFIICDNVGQVFLNDTYLAAQQNNWWDFDPMSPVRLSLPSGRHRMSIRAWNAWNAGDVNPAGLLMTVINTTNGQPITRSDASWNVSYFGAGTSVNTCSR